MKLNVYNIRKLDVDLTTTTTHIEIKCITSISM